MNEVEKKLCKRFDEVLFYQWDPIGISKSAWARDEYESYLPQVFKLVLANDTPAPIAEYLNHISVNNMGLGSGIEHDLEVAELLLELKEMYLG